MSLSAQYSLEVAEKGDKIVFKEDIDQEYGITDLWARRNGTYGVREDLNLFAGGELAKFYPVVDAIVQYSKNNPNLVFKVKVFDSFDDTEIYYFHNGKVQIANARMIADEYDSKKLIDPKIFGAG